MISTDRTIEDEVKIETPYLAIIAACFLLLLALIDSQVVGAITPIIARGLVTTNTAVASSVAIYSISAALVAIGLSQFSHRINSDRWLPIAALLFFVANLVAATAPHIALFFVARALTGFAGGLISALTIAGFANISNYAKRGKQMSLIAICYFLAPVLGVPLGTILSDQYGWRTLFYISAFMIAPAALLVWRFPLTSSNTKITTSNVPHSLREMATRTRSTQMGIVGAFFVSGGLVGFTTYLGSWLSDGFNATGKEIGLLYALAGLVAVAGGALGGLFADRFGKRTIAMQSSILMALFLMILPTFNWSITLFALIAVTSFFASLRIAPLQALITELVEPSERATYIALRNGASQLGIAVAVGASGRLYPSYGLVGVGFLCAALSFGAWYSIRVLDDPHAKKRAVIITQGVMRRVMAVVLVLVVVIFAVLPWLLSLAITKAGTRPDERAMIETPANYGAIYEDVSFKTSDGKKLSGWYLPARDKKINIVMTHGLFRSRYEMMQRGIDLWKEGYGVLLYDLRRHGKSNGEFSSFGYHERLDVLAALDFIKNRAPQEKIVLMGVSMGAAATLLAATDNKAQDVMAIVAESSFLSFSDVIKHHFGLFKIPTFPFAQTVIWLTAWRLNFNPNDIDINEAIKKIHCPILFVGGGDDNRMPNETVLKPLYNAAINPAKKFLIIDKAKHGQAYKVGTAQYKSTLIDFLQNAQFNQTSNK